MPKLPIASLSEVECSLGDETVLSGPNPLLTLRFTNEFGQKIGWMRASVSPLLDCVYLWHIEVESSMRARRYGLRMLAILIDEIGLPVIPVQEIISARGFWLCVHTYACATFPIFGQISVSEFSQERRRWAHLLPATGTYLCHVGRQKLNGTFPPSVKPQGCHYCDVLFPNSSQAQWCRS
ncbi:hypothetical protein D3C72_1594190 [compost metagenome]